MDPSSWEGVYSKLQRQRATGLGSVPPPGMCLAMALNVHMPRILEHPQYCEENKGALWRDPALEKLEM